MISCKSRPSVSTKIAHIADVHVRNLSRHAEYRKVFTAFVEHCKKNGVQHIFVGGDIFHTKTAGMSPECIELMCWLFTSLAEVGIVHVTLGNHDGNLSNMSRQDAVTPIIAALDNPRIKLYKQSGVYPIVSGINLCVFSLFDEEGWESVKPIPGETNIAAYHGPVYGATTEGDWILEDGIRVEFFKDFDIVMLGDIHKTQYMGYKEVELVVDEEDLAKYPGAQVLGAAE